MTIPKGVFIRLSEPTTGAIKELRALGGLGSHCYDEQKTEAIRDVTERGFRVVYIVEVKAVVRATGAAVEE